MNSDDEPGDQAPEVGSTAEEAVKLLGALTDWARDQSATPGDGAEAASEGVEAASGLGASLGRTWTAMLDAHVDTGAPECSWCPVCRTVHVVRHTSPEVRAHLATAASSLLQAAAGLLTAATAPPETGRGRSVERIDLDPDDPDDLLDDPATDEP